MKNLRLTFVIALLAMFGVANAQLDMGIKGGLNISNFYGDALNDRNMKPGFHIGLAADCEFAPNVALQSGVFFSTKGSKYTGEFFGVKGEYSINPMYVQIPVHLAYKIDVTSGTRIVLHAGPYAAYGVAGKSKLKISAGQSSTESNGKNLFGSNGVFNPFDAGLGLGAGAEFGPLMLDLGWDMGLLNISKLKNGNVKTQNAYLSVGYKF